MTFKFCFYKTHFSQVFHVVDDSCEEKKKYFATPYNQ